MKLRNYLYIFAVSMVPVVELRGAIPLGTGLELDPWITYVISVIGNMLPVPFILFFIRKIINWMKQRPNLHKIAVKLEERVHKNKKKIMRFAGFGLFLFVAIPLPGTGAWTGALVAAMIDMRMKYALPAISAGVLVAGLVMTLLSQGFLSFLSFLM